MHLQIIVIVCDLLYEKVNFIWDLCLIFQFLYLLQHGAPFLFLLFTEGGYLQRFCWISVGGISVVIVIVLLFYLLSAGLLMFGLLLYWPHEARFDELEIFIWSMVLQISEKRLINVRFLPSWELCSNLGYLSFAFFLLLLLHILVVGRGQLICELPFNILKSFIFILIILFL